jgi:hypothetical protein
LVVGLQARTLSADLARIPEVRRFLQPTRSRSLLFDRDQIHLPASSFSEILHISASQPENMEDEGNARISRFLESKWDHFSTSREIPPSSEEDRMSSRSRPLHNPQSSYKATLTTSNSGFGSTNNTTGNNSLFGGNKSGGFGSANTSGTTLFGGTNTSSPFGSGGAGGFGSSTGGGFGGSTNSTPGTTFGAFGSNKSSFGSSSGSTLFGAGGAGTTGGFGTTTPFGAAGSGTALGQHVAPSSGTANPPFAVTVEKEAAGTSLNYQSISFQQPYQKYSFEVSIDSHHLCAI